MKKNAPGCCGCGTPALAITIYGCGGLPLAGAAVLVKQAGTTIASYTSSGAQHYILVPGPGTYTVEATKDRFDAGSVTGTAAAGVTTPVTLTLAAAAGYRCCSGCPDPYPTTLYLAYAGRTIVLAYGVSTLTGAVGWHGTATFNRSGYRLGPYGGCVSVGTIPIPFFYTLLCPAPAPGGGGLFGWDLQELAWVCGSSGDAFVTDESDPVGDTLRQFGNFFQFGYGPCVIPLVADFGDETLTRLVTETPSGGTGVLAVAVAGCNGLAVPGATVSAVQGAATVTATSDSSGLASLILDSGSWLVTASRARFDASAPSSQAITAGGTTSLSVALGADSGHVCVPGCALPISKTLVLTDPAGAHTITWDGTAWAGCYLVSTNQSISFCGSTFRSTNNIPVRYSLSTGKVLTASYPGCGSSTPATEGAPLAGQTCAGYPWVSATTYAVPVTLTGPCTPLWTGTMKLPSDAWPNGPPGCLIDGAITVTE